MNASPSDLILTLTDPTGTRRYTLPVKSTATLPDLARDLFAARRLTLDREGLVVGDLFRGPSPPIYFYFPRRGLLSPKYSLAENGATSAEDLTFYQPDPLPAGLGDIQLNDGRPLNQAAMLLVIDAGGRYYPVIVPVRLGPDEASVSGLLAEIIIRQLTELGAGALPDPADPATQLINARTGHSALAAAAPVDLGSLYQQGDLVFLRGAGDSVPAFAPQALIDAIEITPDNAPAGDQIEFEEFELEIVDPIAAQIVIGDNQGGTAMPRPAQRRALTIGRATLELVRGDITRQQTDAIVNAANQSLAGGGGVDGEIHRAAGPELVRASRPLAPCLPGRAVLTPGYRLPARWVIHTVGPIYQGGKQGEPEVLAQAYVSCLTIARDSGFQSIAFPSISTGVYGYPMEAAAPVALKTCADWLRQHETPALVRFVFVTDAGFNAFAAALDRLEEFSTSSTPAPLPSTPPAATIELLPNDSGGGWGDSAPADPQPEDLPGQDLVEMKAQADDDSPVLYTPMEDLP